MCFRTCISATKRCVIYTRMRGFQGHQKDEPNAVPPSATAGNGKVVMLLRQIHSDLRDEPGRFRAVAEGLQTNT